MSQITEKIFLGTANQACNDDFIMSKNITHILVCGSNIAKKYEIDDNCKKIKRNIKYHQLNLKDKPDENILNLFTQAFQFIEDVVNSQNDYTILIHCLGGISRSPTVVTAYLMITQYLSFQDALQKLKTLHKKTNPNPGFQVQLEFYDIQILELYKQKQAQDEQKEFTEINMGLIRSLIKQYGWQYKQKLQDSNCGKSKNWRKETQKGGKGTRKDKRAGKQKTEDEYIDSQEFNFNEKFDQIKKKTEEIQLQAQFCEDENEEEEEIIDQEEDYENIDSNQNQELCQYQEQEETKEEEEQKIQN